MLQERYYDGVPTLQLKKKKKPKSGTNRAISLKIYIFDDRSKQLPEIEENACREKGKL